MLPDTCCDPEYIEYPFRYKHLFEGTDSTQSSERMFILQTTFFDFYRDKKRFIIIDAYNHSMAQMDPNHISNNHKTKSKSKSFVFWKKTPSKTPGSIKQVRGAQYPPIMNDKNPYKSSGTHIHII